MSNREREFKEVMVGKNTKKVMTYEEYEQSIKEEAALNGDAENWKEWLENDDEYKLMLQDEDGNLKEYE